MTAVPGYDKDSFLTEFFPDEADRHEVESGAHRLVAENRTHRVVETRRRPGLIHADVADHPNGGGTRR